MKRLASRTRKATATATPSGPPGPYAPFGTTLEGAGLLGGAPGIASLLIAEP